VTTRIIIGDALSSLRELPDESVHCVITSPPYWGLRSYKGDDGMIGLEETFEEHLDLLVEVFQEVHRVLRSDGTLWLNYGDAYVTSPRGNRTAGGGGLTNSNIGSAVEEERWKAAASRNRPHVRTGHTGLKHKDLMGMPWRVALALQADGWWLRRDIIWHKQNPTPESSKDRPTTSHEYLFILTKRPRYFYDDEAVKEPVSGNAHARDSVENRRARARVGTKSVSTAERRGMTPSHERPGSTNHRGLDLKPGVTPKSAPAGSGIRMNESYQAAMIDMTPMRSLRSVWTIATSPYREAHFATFPPALVEPCVKAGTSEKGVCPDCDAPWERIVEKGVTFESGSGRSGNAPEGKWAGTEETVSGTYDIRLGPVICTKTTGWHPTCDCYDERYREVYPEPRRARKRRQRSAWPGRWKRVRAKAGKDDWPIKRAVVLDPFGGAGTVGLVADRLGRDSILVEINPEYAEMAKRRIYDDAPLLSEVAAE